MFLGLALGWLMLFAACGSNDPISGPQDPALVAEPSHLTIISSPGPSSGCWLYTASVEPDTVLPPLSSEEPAIVEIRIQLIEDQCFNPPRAQVDGVSVLFFGPSEAIPSGLPVADSLPAGWSLQEADFECDIPEECHPWILDAITDGSGVVRFPYRTSGVAGVDSIRVFPYIVDVTAGPEIVLPLVTALGLRVVCDPEPIPRGEVITCEAMAQDPEAEVEILEWRFTDGQHAVTHQPEVPGDRDWAGTMAVGGTFTIKAIVDGDSAEASTTVTVDPRDWHDIEQLPPAIQQSCPASGETLVFPCPLVRPPMAPHDFGQTGLEREWAGSFFEIDSGPNDGWSMILSEDPETARYAYKYLAHIVSYNPILDDPADTLWPSGCNVADMKNVVLDHEWQHVALLRDSLSAADLPPNDRLEKWIVFGPRDSLEAQIQDTVSALIATLNRYADNPEPHQVIQTALPPNCDGFFSP